MRVKSLVTCFLLLLLPVTAAAQGEPFYPNDPYFMPITEIEFTGDGLIKCGFPGQWHLENNAPDDMHLENQNP